MTTFAKFTATAILGLFALSALGNAKPHSEPSTAAVRTLTAHEAMNLRAAQWSRGCTGSGSSATALAGPIADLDVAGAALIAHGEGYYGKTTRDIRDAVALLPRWMPEDGISETEEAALAMVLKLGRQLAYAEAAETIESALGRSSGTVVLVDASAGFTPEVLAALRPAC